MQLTDHISVSNSHHYAPQTHLLYCNNTLNYGLLCIRVFVVGVQQIHNKSNKWNLSFTVRPRPTFLALWFAAKLTKLTVQLVRIKKFDHITSNKINFSIFRRFYTHLLEPHAGSPTLTSHWQTEMDCCLQAFRTSIRMPTFLIRLTVIYEISGLLLSWDGLIAFTLFLTQRKSQSPAGR